MKGKRGATVNADLRTRLHDAADARARLERRLLAAEHERDAALAKLDKWTAEGNPAVVAERERANAIQASVDSAVRAEREKWEALRDGSIDTICLLMDFAAKKGESEGLLVLSDLPALCELYGDELAKRIPAGRHGRRVIKAGEKAARRQLAFAAEMKKQGVL